MIQFTLTITIKHKVVDTLDKLVSQRSVKQPTRRHLPQHFTLYTGGYHVHSGISADSRPVHVE